MGLEAWPLSGRGKHPQKKVLLRRPAASMSWVCKFSSVLTKLTQKLLPWQVGLPAMWTKQSNCKRRCYMAKEYASARSWRTRSLKSAAVVTATQVAAAVTITIYDMNAESTLQRNEYYDVLILQGGAGSVSEAVPRMAVPGAGVVQVTILRMFGMATPGLGFTCNPDSRCAGCLYA